jgi:hypothetical protein
MNGKRQAGFILALVIVTLALVGVAMFVLTEGANTMLFRADAAHVRAVERDLIASGLAWAQQRIAAVDPPADEPVELSTASLGAPGAQLVVRILEVRPDEARVQIETACRKGRQTRHTSRTYAVPLP